MSVKPLPVHGVDISHHQGGAIDFAGAKRRGLRWVYHKATEGDSFTDANYGRRRTEAKKAGIPFGAYHFARPERGDAAAEARRFLSVAKPVPGDLRPALDLETDEGLTLSQIRIWAATFVKEVVRIAGVKPVIYTPYDLGAADDDCVIWRPRYNNTNTPPVLRWDVWQFSNGVFGVPNQLAGFGHVDLNTHRAGLDLNDLLIPTPKPEPKPTKTVRMGHASLQFSDSPAQWREDCDRIFEKALARDWKWITGTEAAQEENLEILRASAKEHGFRLFKPQGSIDGWIAVRRDFISGNWEQDFRKVIPSSGELRKEGVKFPEAKRFGAKGVVSVGFDTEEFGRINVATAHYLTDARNPSSMWWPYNRSLALAIGEWAVESGAGKALAFYGGDQNMADSRNTEPQGDTFFGAPLTSLWDEIGKWENTGHGNIDVIATYDRDGRVVAKASQALDDREFPLHTDHFLVEGAVEIRLAA